MLKIPVFDTHLKITNLKLQPHLPGASELTHFSLFMQWYVWIIDHNTVEWTLFIETRKVSTKHATWFILLTQSLQIMFTLHLRRDHLPCKTTHRCGLFREVPLQICDVCHHWFRQWLVAYSVPVHCQTYEGLLLIQDKWHIRRKCVLATLF